MAGLHNVKHIDLSVCVHNSKLPVDIIWKRLVTITCHQKADRRLQAIQLLLKLLSICTTSRFDIWRESFLRGYQLLYGWL